MGSLSQHELLTQLLSTAPRGDDLANPADTGAWFRRTLSALDEHEIAEGSHLAVLWAEHCLTSMGAMAYDHHGRRLTFQQRHLQGQALVNTALSILADASSERERRLKELRKLAEHCIRQAAGQQALVARGNRQRDEWLVELRRRMATSPASAATLTTLAASLEASELLRLLDQVLKEVFGV